MTFPGRRLRNNFANLLFRGQECREMGIIEQNAPVKQATNAEYFCLKISRQEWRADPVLQGSYQETEKQNRNSVLSSGNGG